MTTQLVVTKLGVEEAFSECRLQVPVRRFVVTVDGRRSSEMTEANMVIIAT